MNTPSDELKPCPFCSAIPDIEFSHEAGQWDVYEIECDCGISVYGPCGHQGDEAKNATIRKWNTRPEAAQEIERLRSESFWSDLLTRIDSASLRPSELAKEIVAALSSSGEGV